MKRIVTTPENIEWIKKREEFLKNIGKFEAVGDRIKTTTQLSYIHNALHESVLGWHNWINGWISIELTKGINITDPEAISLTNAELNELHNAFKEFTTKFIELDVKYTEIITKKIVKKKKFSPYVDPQEEESIEDKYKRVIV